MITIRFSDVNLPIFPRLISWINGSEWNHVDIILDKAVYTAFPYYGTFKTIKHKEWNNPKVISPQELLDIFT